MKLLEIAAILVAILLLIGTYLLSAKLSVPLWGGVIPILLLIGSVLVFAWGRLPMEWGRIFPFILLNVAFFSMWESGRIARKKKLRKEMDQMKSKDM